MVFFFFFFFLFFFDVIITGRRQKRCTLSRDMILQTHAMTAVMIQPAALSTFCFDKLLLNDGKLS